MIVNLSESKAEHFCSAFFRDICFFIRSHHSTNVIGTLSASTGTIRIMLVKSYCFVSVCLTPIVKSQGVDMFTEVTVHELYVGVISPGTCNKAASLLNPLFGCETAICCYEANFNIERS